MPGDWRTLTITPSHAVQSMSTKKSALPLCTLALAGMVAMGLTGCASDQVEVAEAQNPMGGEAMGALADASPDEAVRAEVAAAGTSAWNLAFGSTAADATSCMERRIGDLHAAAADSLDATRGRRHAGESASFALASGWYPQMPEFQHGSILPCARIVAYYGNPNSTRMGALGEFPKEEMLRRLQNQVAEWERADPSTPVVPALHMVAVVANDHPGPTGHYRTIMRDSDVQKVYDWAREINGVFFVDIQVGTDDIRNILPRFEWILKNPDVHLGVDPEFMMKDGSRPGTRVGTMDAADVNYVTGYLAQLVREHNLPPKVFILHRFTSRMVTNSQNIQLRPEVHVVNHMDGWGAQWLKKDTWRDQTVREPIQFSGFKIFYKHDQSREGWALMTPRDMLQLHPVPLYIQYQ
jgi:hypothetical protein